MRIAWKIFAVSIIGIAAVMLPTAPASAADGGCVGSWHPPREVNGVLEWGVTSICGGTGWTPHRVEVSLQRGHHWIMFTTVDTAKSQGYEQGSPNISVHETTSCDSDAETTYRLVATIRAGSTEGSIISEDEYTVSCYIE
ncbi:hypothetical protein ACL02S_14320 [Nocardia sp. 004]|uniref:hypothetical protein n=1 Tax=Nocardia sp. 004 TaxID=3385978 RepID=UPI0039A2FB87